MSIVLKFIYVLLFIPIDNKLLQITTYINLKHICMIYAIRPLIVLYVFV